MVVFQGLEDFLLRVSVNNPGQWLLVGLCENFQEVGLFFYTLQDASRHMWGIALTGVQCIQMG